MYPNRFKKGQPLTPHKEGCKCFRCSGIPWNKGKTMDQAYRETVSKSLIGTARRYKRYNGKFITYSGIHKWLGKRLPNKGTCNECKTVTRTEISNNVNVGRSNFDEWSQELGEEIRNFKYWEWLCKSCHGKKDQWENGFKEYWASLH